MILAKHSYDDLHAFLRDIVPAQVEVLDLRLTVEALAQQLQAILTYLAVGQAERLEVMQSLRHNA